MTSKILAGIVGICLSLAFPGIKQRYDALKPSMKQSVMGGLLVLVTVAIFGLSCTGLNIEILADVVCSTDGAVELAGMLIAAGVANQSTFLLTKKH